MAALSLLLRMAKASKKRTADRIKLKLSVVLANGFLQALSKLGGESLPIKDRYALARTIKGIDSDLATYEPLRQALVKKHGKLLNPPESEQYTIEPANMPAFAAEIKELQAQEIELFLDHKITLPPNCPLTAGEMALIEDLIDEPVS